MLQLYTFGGLRIECDGQPLQLPTHKARDLLAYLVTFRDRPHPRPVMAGILWPDLPEEKARRRLSDTLWRVRRAAGPDVILADEDTLAFNPACDHWLDVAEFEDRAQEAGREEQTTTDCLSLYLGPFLDGLYHDWVLLERERLHMLYLESLGRLLELHKQAGDYESGLTIAQRIVAAEPLHEAAHRELMRFYHFLGRDAEAIAQYHRCREMLREELDVAPAPETESLYHVLSRRAPPHAGVPAMYLPAPARRPVPDLDELPLVGRDAERAALLRHLEAAAAGQGGLVLLEGEPGIGKSRLARELIAGARWRNIHTTTAASDEAGASSSYGLLLAALTPVLTPLRFRQLARLVAPHHLQAAALLLPSLSPLLSPLSSPLPSLPPAPGPRADKAGVWGDSHDGYGVLGASSNSYGVFGWSSNNYGMYATGSAGDLRLGGSGGTIHADTSSSSSLRLYSNNYVDIHLDDDSNSTSQFRVYNDANIAVFTVNESGAVSWQAQTGYVSIPAAAFRPKEDGYDFTNAGNQLINNDDASDNYYAPVQLPHGATVTKMTFYWRDESPLSGQAQLTRDTMTGFSFMAQAFTSGDTGHGSSSTTSISDATIDNSQYAYYLYWNLPVSTVKGCGVVIEYTYTGPY